MDAWKQGPALFPRSQPVSVKMTGRFVQFFHFSGGEFWLMEDFSSSSRLKVPEIGGWAEKRGDWSGKCDQGDFVFLARLKGEWQHTNSDMTLIAMSHAGTKEGACMVVGSPRSVCTIFEILVVLFQVCGIMGLCLNRLMPRSTRWSSRGQVGLIVALFGLGIAGALCGRHDSEFALFAGGTMTVLLIGMSMGSGAIEKTEPARPRVTAEAELAV